MREESGVVEGILHKKLMLGIITTLFVIFIPPIPILSIHFSLTLPQILIVTLLFGFFWLVAASMLVHNTIFQPEDITELTRINDPFEETVLTPELFQDVSPLTT